MGGGEEDSKVLDYLEASHRFDGDIFSNKLKSLDKFFGHASSDNLDLIAEGDDDDLLSLDDSDDEKAKKKKSTRNISYGDGALELALQKKTEEEIPEDSNPVENAAALLPKVTEAVLTMNVTPRTNDRKRLPSAPVAPSNSSSARASEEISKLKGRRNTSSGSLKDAAKKKDPLSRSEHSVSRTDKDAPRKPTSKRFSRNDLYSSSGHGKRVTRKSVAQEKDETKSKSPVRTRTRVLRSQSSSGDADGATSGQSRSRSNPRRPTRSKSNVGDPDAEDGQGRDRRSRSRRSSSIDPSRAAGDADSDEGRSRERRSRSRRSSSIDPSRAAAGDADSEEGHSRERRSRRSNSIDPVQLEEDQSRRSRRAGRRHESCGDLGEQAARSLSSNRRPRRRRAGGADDDGAPDDAMAPGHQSAQFPSSALDSLSGSQHRSRRGRRPRGVKQDQNLSQTWHQSTSSTPDWATEWDQPFEQSAAPAAPTRQRRNDRSPTRSGSALSPVRKPKSSRGLTRHKSADVTRPTSMRVMASRARVPDI